MRGGILHEKYDEKYCIGHHRDGGGNCHYHILEIGKWICTYFAAKTGA